MDSFLVLTLICSTALDINKVSTNHRTYDLRLKTCEKVTKRASKANLNPILIASLSWVESGFLPHVKSNKGAIGPLQILPKYFCPKRRAKGCDLIEAGIKAFKAWRKAHPKLRDTLCHYNNGTKCYRSGYRYADKILTLAQNIKLLIKMNTPIYGPSRTRSDGGIP